MVSATRPEAFLDPIHQRAHRHRVVRHRQPPRKIVCLAQAFHPQGGLMQCNSLNPALQNASERDTSLANLMLDEPPLIVRTDARFDLMADSFINGFPCL
jgi:hypothetical protein